MTKKPKVSILMPTYNASEFITQAIESIVSQNYENIELVICDDASTDDTKNKLIELKEKFPDKISLNFNDKNIGITKNCNKILSLCTGDYICLFAGDDIMLQNKISDQVNQLESDSEAALSYHQVEIFNSRNNEILEITEKKRTIYSAFDIIDKIGIPGANSLMVRASCIPAGGYNQNIPAVSDWLFFIEIALRGRILFLPRIYSKYRKHDKGASTRTYQTLNETLMTLDIIENRFNHDHRIKKTCDRGRFRYVAGEFARLLKENDAEKIKKLNNHHNSIILKFIIFIYLLLRPDKLQLGNLLYNLLKKYR